MRTLYIFLGLFFTLVSFSQANEFKPPQRSTLEGSIHTVGANYMDPGPDYEPDTNIIITINGVAAEQVFNSIKTVAEEFLYCPWADDGDCFPRIVKSSNGISCLKTNSSSFPTCEINYDLVNQEFLSDPSGFLTGGDI
jgi:hypothetical protein